MQKLRLLLSLLIISIAFTGLFAATKAFFSTTATSTDNIITSGTLVFTISDSDESQQGTISGSWVGSDLAPGDSIAQQSVIIQNGGVINGDHLNVTVAYTGSEELA